MTEFISELSELLKNAGTILLEAIAMLTLGLLVIRIFIKVLKFIFIRSKVEGSASSFMISIIDFIVTMVLFFMVMRKLGINTNSLVAIVAASGLAVGLALQDSLKNLASGIILLYTKPFKEDDAVAIGSSEGLVKAIKIMTTELATFDNRRIIIPNAKIVSSEIINNSARQTRRSEIKVYVSYNSDPDKVKSLLRELVAADERILKTPEPMIFLSEFGNSSITYTLRTWLPISIFWDVHNNMLEKVFKLFKDNDIEIPFNQLVVHTNNKENKLL